MKMTLAEALKILEESNIVTEDYPVKMSAKKWKEIVDSWAAKVKEQEDLLADNPQWIGRPAELSTKKLIKKYKGYYEQALRKYEEQARYEDEMARQEEEAEYEAEMEMARNYDFDYGDVRY